MRRLAVSLLTVAALAACNEVDVIDASASGSSSASSGSVTSTSVGSSSSSGAGGSVPTVLFEATLVPNGPGPPIADADVCAYGAPALPCAKSDENGVFDLEIPANAETGLLISKTGRGSILIPIATTDEDMFGAVLGVPTTTQLESYYESAGTPYPDPGFGFLAVFIQPGNDFQTGLAGATVTLAPAVGAGPLYADAQGNPDAALTMTTAGGAARFGAMPLAVVEVHPTCPSGLVPQSVFFGWLGGDSSSVRVPIAEGFETRVGFGCF